MRLIASTVKQDSRRRKIFLSPVPTNREWLALQKIYELRIVELKRQVIVIGLSGERGEHLDHPLSLRLFPKPIEDDASILRKIR